MSTPIGIVNTFAGVDAGREHELVHLRVRDLHAVDARARAVVNVS